MFKQDIRLFIVSFLLTLLAVGSICLFLLVDRAGAQYQIHSSPPALALEQAGDAMHYRACLLGKEYSLSLEYYNTIERIRKEYAYILTPRALRIAEQIYGLSVHGFSQLYNQYKAEQYAQNVAKEQPQVPIS